MILANPREACVQEVHTSLAKIDAYVAHTQPCFANEFAPYSFLCPEQACF